MGHLQGSMFDLIRYFWGQDTSSAVLSWAVTFLADRPHLIDDMRTEISRVLGTRSIHTLGYEDLSQLTLCEQVIRETLRMRPPVPCTDRGVVHDSQIGDHFLPSGVSTSSPDGGERAILTHSRSTELCVSVFHGCTFR